LGLLPERYPLIQRLLEMLEEQIAGLYDPHGKQLYIVGDVPARELILAHELTHALQDQHFDLVRLQGDPKGNDDRSFAVTALIEGDATLTMLLHLGKTMSFLKALQLVPDFFQLMAMDDTKIRAAPSYVRESLVRTYTDGMRFVATLKRRGGWDRVNRAYHHPPSSSEQILHPDKYLEGEPPLAVPLGDLCARAGAGWKRIHENTLGEIGVLLLLKGESELSLHAEAAASGWGGDRLQTCRRPDGAELVVWKSLWDSRADADQFFEAMAAHLNERYTALPTRGAQAWKSNRGYALLTRADRAVLLVDGAPRQDLGRILARACGIVSGTLQ
jgi:hypothetical protein